MKKTKTAPSPTDSGRPKARALPVINQKRNVPLLLQHIANHLAVSAGHAYQEGVGVGLTEWRVIVQIAIEAEITANRICAIVGLDKASVSRAVSALQARGLIEVSAADGRSNALTLTAAGRRLHDAGMPIARERQRRLLAGLSGAERNTLIDLLTRMFAKLDHVAALSPTEAIARARTKRQKKAEAGKATPKDTE